MSRYTPFTPFEAQLRAEWEARQAQLEQMQPVRGPERVATPAQARCDARRPTPPRLWCRLEPGHAGPHACDGVIWEPRPPNAGVGGPLKGTRCAAQNPQHPERHCRAGAGHHGSHRWWSRTEHVVFWPRAA